MRRARWLAEWRNSDGKPVFYHCISRVVERRFAFGAEEKEKFRALMRMQEKFTGCRVVAYCLMCNHFHLLLEVPPMSAEGISDELLLKRLSAIYSEAFVAEIAEQLADARKLGQEKRIAEIHERFTYRMHDLGEFMKGLLQRFTQWFNRTQGRTGRLWEDRFKSVIVEDGFAAKTMAAYIDLNPVRAGMVKDPADYRWSSYGEAIGGGPKGNGKTARAGLVRALRAHKGVGADAGFWKNDVAREYRKMLMEGALEKSEEVIDRSGKRVKRTLRKGISRAEAERSSKDDGDLPMAATLRRRVRYFSDGAVIGSRLFVNEAFRATRERFGPKRKDGARKLIGNAAPLSGQLWSIRDLKRGVG
ncbi:transposase [Luteolibacter pohnpeiensis]|uniref:Transposase n=1 Tax=Luteolibacter pohnpeiensis TaxID=454153 RepID=A0A934S836_9BACT|nr:transposase [Luteolibacter pohnpeiensis]MBK1882556.1 transposase [Luteolibacter pohnpeiensis]